MRELKGAISRKMEGGASPELVHRCSHEVEGKFCLGFYWEQRSCVGLNEPQGFDS